MQGRGIKKQVRFYDSKNRLVVFRLKYRESHKAQKRAELIAERYQARAAWYQEMKGEVVTLNLRVR